MRSRERLNSDPACHECTLEMNPGNHFVDAELRMAKGFAWIMEQNSH